MSPKEKNTAASAKTTQAADAISQPVSKTEGTGRIFYHEFRKEPHFIEEPGISSLKSFIAELENDGYGPSIAEGRKIIAPNFADIEGKPTLRSLRLASGLSQAQLAEKAKLKQYQISRYENGLENPQIETAKRIRRALGVDASTFYRVFDSEDE